MIEYTVKEKRFSQEEKGECYAFCLGSSNPVFQSSIVAVTGADWAAFKVGDKINIAISAAPVTA
jgi:hypothetical protein